MALFGRWREEFTRSLGIRQVDLSWIASQKCERKLKKTCDKINKYTTFVDEHTWVDGACIVLKPGITYIR